MTTVLVPDAPDYAHWGGHNELLSLWWRDVCIEANENGSPRLTEAEALVEAATKIDFATWLYGYVATAFYTAYERVDSQWRLYAGLQEVANFKEWRIKGKNRLRGFGYIGDHAHAPGMRRSYRPEASLFIDTYGAGHAVTRQAIIDGDAQQILADDPADMGTAAMEYLAAAVVALMESNPTAPDGLPFFSTSRPIPNLTTDEISGTSLMAAYTSFQTRRQDGSPIRIVPRRLIVQNRTIAAIALRDITSTTAIGQTSTTPANTDFPRGNTNAVSQLPWPEDFVVEEPWLNDFNDGYMIADPERYPAWMVGMLAGNTQPSLWQSQGDMTPVGGSNPSPYQMRVKILEWEVLWDIGVSAINPDVAFKWSVA